MHPQRVIAVLAKGTVSGVIRSKVAEPFRTALGWHVRCSLLHVYY